jgi:hypothetical protein
VNIEEALTRACAEPTLVKALSWIAIWETERVVQQAAQYEKTGGSTAACGGKWDTCFDLCFTNVIARWKAMERLKDCFLHGQPDSNLISEVTRVLAPLAAIADAYDNDDIDEARSEWDKGLERNEDKMVELVQGRCGRTLLTLGQALEARDVLRDLEREISGERPRSTTAYDLSTVVPGLAEEWLLAGPADVDKLPDNISNEDRSRLKATFGEGHHILRVVPG